LDISQEETHLYQDSKDDRIIINLLKPTSYVMHQKV